MSVWTRLLTWIKGRRQPRGEERAALLAAPLPAAPAGWWRDDHSEQLRHYQSWVYAAVNAIAQEVAMQRPYLYATSGQAEHQQTPLPFDHPLARLLDGPNPWTTPWELWYLTTVYLELTGNSFTKRIIAFQGIGPSLSAYPQQRPSSIARQTQGFHPFGATKPPRHVVPA